MTRELLAGVGRDRVFGVGLLRGVADRLGMRTGAPVRLWGAPPVLGLGRGVRAGVARPWLVDLWRDFRNNSRFRRSSADKAGWIPKPDGRNDAIE